MKETENKKLTTDILFEKTICQTPRHVRTQDVDEPVSSWETVHEYLLAMFADEDQFVTLTIAEISCGIRYVQATQSDDGIVVQLGLEEDEHTRLVEKICSPTECLLIFAEFYHSTTVPDIEKYQPVAFWV